MCCYTVLDFNHKSAADLLLCSYQADIRMHLHGFFHFDDNKSAASCQLIQVVCQDFLPIGLMQVVSTTCIKYANIKLHKV